MKTIFPLILLLIGEMAMMAQAVFRSPAKTAADYRLWESFEAYPGNDIAWAPTGWTFKSEVGNVPNETGITWHVTEGIAMFNMLPTDGNFIAYLNGALSSEGQTQDEWMISPAFTPSVFDYLSFDANYSPLFMFIDYAAYDTT
ncbi:MAG: hypothetical protein LBS25_00760, partial [Candidatus Symbiothrix sp.]|nr:hypothetical protein [Candidatus Symbiothrix sp.]